jgi:hypothetical protein
MILNTTASQWYPVANVRSLKMRKWLAGFVLFLAVPMIVLNPLGRPAFLGYYVGVVATWVAYAFALRRKHVSSSLK